MLHGLEPQVDPLLEGVEVSFGGNVSPAHRRHQLHERLGPFGAEHLLEAKKQLVTGSLIQGHDPPPHGRWATQGERSRPAHEAGRTIPNGCSLCPAKATSYHPQRLKASPSEVVPLGGVMNRWFVPFG
jgi:hypothetical protein